MFFFFYKEALSMIPSIHLYREDWGLRLFLFLFFLYFDFRFVSLRERERERERERDLLASMCGRLMITAL